ncbi:MAG TPA: efflux RND transporter periplasmic adaptor subunit [Candidatus Kryptonia bacterium]|nr:efflux RND transporter periplasmic adaptor subunit [Candidatus Kryptonia bacterium]
MIYSATDTSTVIFASALAALLFVGCDRGAPSADGKHVYVAAAAAKPEKKILYWYDPMHPQVRSDKPGPSPDQCGMDLVPMYAEEGGEEESATVHISAERQQLTGVRTAAVERRTLSKLIRTVGVVTADESRVRKIQSKVAGWIEKLHVSFTGQAVERNQPIVSIYSPDLVSTQSEYLLALRGHEELHHSPFPQAAASAQTLLEATRRRLLLWDITPQQIRALEENGQPTKTLTLHSPIGGFVMMKGVFEGAAITPGMDLYTVTDLSRVWVLLDVYQYEMPSVHVGTPVSLTMSYFPGEQFEGVVNYVYPYLDEKTRTDKVRVEFDNANLQLKPEMYASAEIRVPLTDRLALPEDAVIDSGNQQVVFVATGEGHFEPRPVRLGQRADGYIEVLDGVHAGEQVVVAANFMVDSESRLKAALADMGHQHDK